MLYAYSMRHNGSVYDFLVILTEDPIQYELQKENVASMLWCFIFIVN
jgi:hypothetical protein